jgi:hypothetical protein
MSPAKAIVMGWGGGVVEVVVEIVDGVVDGVEALEEAGGGPGDVSDEAELQPAARASEAHPRATAALRCPPRIVRAYSWFVRGCTPR